MAGTGDVCRGTVNAPLRGLDGSLLAAALHQTSLMHAFHIIFMDRMPIGYFPECSCPSAVLVYPWLKQGTAGDLCK